MQFDSGSTLNFLRLGNYGENTVCSHANKVVIAIRKQRYFLAGTYCYVLFFKTGMTLRAIFPYSTANKI